MGLKYTDADIDAVVIQKQRKRIAELEAERESLYDKRIEMNEIIARRDITIERLRGAIKEALWWGEQHTDSAVGRRIHDFKMALKVLRAALERGQKDENL